MNISFQPLEQFGTTHKQNIQLLNEKAKFIAGILLHYKIQQTQDGVLHSSVYQKAETFSEGNLIYLLVSHVSSPQMGTTKF